jgi:lysophospholipase L1-like esterase
MVTRIVVLLTLLFTIRGTATSQTKDVVIVVIGSSTAEGAGAWPSDSSWVNRLKFSVTRDGSDGADTVVYNLGKGGYTTYRGRENGYVPPPGNFGPDPDRNISKALALNPDIILVNYPSNDVANYMSTQATMDNYQMYNSLTSAAGKKIYFFSTQPRNGLSYDQTIQLRDQKDAIISTFMSRAINVWDFLVGADGFSLKTEVNSGDGIHVNNGGHRLIFEKVQSFLAAALLPVKLSKFDAVALEKRIDLNWETASETNNSHFVIERSLNGREFKAIGEIKGKGNSNSKVKYTFSDKSPVTGKNYYRLKQVDLDGKFTFSQVVAVSLKSAPSAVLLYPVPAYTSINLKIAADKKESIQINIYDRSGNTKSSFTRNLDKGENLLQFPVSSLPTGNYVMQIKQESTISKRSFIKL